MPTDFSTQSYYNMSEFGSMNPNAMAMNANGRMDLHPVIVLEANMVVDKNGCVSTTVKPTRGNVKKVQEIQRKLQSNSMSLTESKR